MPARGNGRAIRDKAGRSALVLLAPFLDRGHGVLDAFRGIGIGVGPDVFPSGEIT